MQIKNRVPMGVPTGGEFAATVHGEPGIVLVLEHAGDPDAHGDLWKTDYDRSDDLITVIGRQDGDYTMEVQQHCPSGQASWQTIRHDGGIDRVVGNGLADGLDAAQEAAKAAARPTPGKLAWAQCLGMEGTFIPYAGSDSNVEQPALTWTSPGGREIHLSGIGTGRTEAYWDGNGDDDYSTRFGVDEDHADTDAPRALRDAAAYAAVMDAVPQTAGIPEGGDMYELREVGARQGMDGAAVVELEMLDVDNDREVTLSYNAGTGAVSMSIDGERVDASSPLGRETFGAELDAILTDSRVDWAGSPAEHAAGAFGRLLQQAAADPDAPAWMG